MTKIYKGLGKRGRITIPYEIRRHTGFVCNDILSFTESEDGRTVVIRREKICDGCRPAEKEADKRAELLNFLEGLTTEEQRAALIHLSVMWAEKQGGSVHRSLYENSLKHAVSQGKIAGDIGE